MVISVPGLIPGLILFSLLIILSSSSSAEIDLDASLRWAQENYVGTDLPKGASSLLKNERIILYVEDKEWVLNGITKDGNVKSIGKGELDHPTLLIYTTTTTIEEILSSQDQIRAFIDAKKGDKIRLHPLGVVRTVKFSIASLLTIFFGNDDSIPKSVNEDLPEDVPEKNVKRRLYSDTVRPLPEPKPQQLEPQYITESEETEETENIPCETIGDCSDGKPLCFDGFCRTLDEFIVLANSCDTIEDCRDGQICESNRCVNESIPEEDSDEIACEDVGDCPSEKPFCQGNICVSLSEVIAASNYCETTEDCAENEVCKNNRCASYAPLGWYAQICELDEDCREGMICSDGRCAIPVEPENPEEPDLVGPESEGTTYSSCDSDEACAADEICVASVCIVGYRSCDTSEDCIEGKICRDEKCVALRAVPPPQERSVGERIRTLFRTIFRQEPIPYGDDVRPQEGDLCAQNDRYNNGVCDEDCPNPDPDCEEAEDCDNTIDDDGDDRIDCRDSDCDSIRRDSDRKRCQYRIESRCSDDFDNDADGFTDCADTDCEDNDACAEPEVPDISTLGWGEFDHCKRRLLIINDLQTCIGSGYLLSNKVIAVRIGPVGADLTPLDYEVLEQDGEYGRSARLCSSLQTIDPVNTLATANASELYDQEGCPVDGTYEGVNVGYRYFDIPVDEDSTVPITYDLQINFGRTEECVAGGDKKKFENNINCCGYGSLKSFRVPIENHGINKAFFLRLSSVVPACDYYESAQCSVPSLSTCVS